MGSELQSGKFINPSQDAQEDGVEKVAVKDRTIVFKILQGWRVTHVYIINLTFVQHTCLCENRICATEQGVMTENMKQNAEGCTKKNPAISQIFELHVSSDKIPEDCERHDSSGARGVMRKGKTLYYLHKDVYDGDRLESRISSYHFHEDILPEVSVTVSSTERLILKFLRLVLGVSVVVFTESFFMCLRVCEPFAEEGAQELNSAPGKAYQKEANTCLLSTLVFAMWIILMLILTALLPFCLSFSETRGNVSKVLYGHEQVIFDSTADWLEKQPEVSKKLDKWYLDWCPESVKKFCTNSVAYPASQTGSLEQYFSQKFSGQSLSEKEEMKYEWLRLQSFQDWPAWAIPFPSVLAKAGFSYSKTADKVVCFSCEGVVEGWRQDMTPIDVHREKFPHCKFIAGREENFPILPMESSEVSPVVSDVLGRTGTSRPSLNPENSPQPVSESSLNDSGFPSRNRVAEGSIANPVLNVTQVSADLRDSGFADSARSSEAVEGVSGSFINRMKHEHNRYLTYRSWPSTDFNQPKLLAKAGFYYTGLRFKVLCAFCNGTLDYSDPQQEPMAYHRELFPDCPFVLSPNSVNIPAYPVPPPGPTPPPAVQADLAMLGIMSDSPKHPEYSMLQARIDSFRGWSPEREQKPYELAVAGFIYAGMSDCVKCFQCDGGLRNWLPGDIPWVEHARWFPQCSHVRLCKGQEFIDTIEEMYPRQGAANSTTITRSNTATNVSTPNVDRLMSSPAAMSVLEMGYARDLVRRALEMFIRQKATLQDIIKLAYRGHDFPKCVPMSMPCLHFNDSVMEVTSFGSDSGLNAHELVEILLEIPNVAEDPSAQGEDQEPSTSPLHPLAGAAGHKSLPNFPRSNSSIVDESEIGEELDTKSLREKNRELIEQTLCKICLENKMCITFLPCGHLVCCAECAPALRKCPICRSTIKGRVRVYMS